MKYGVMCTHGGKVSPPLCTEVTAEVMLCANKVISVLPQLKGMWRGGNAKRPFRRRYGDLSLG